jgi:predicted nucleic acid-binding protein
MAVYVETSAVLRAVVEKDAAVLDAVRKAGREGITSRLTFLEMGRGLSRAVRGGRLDATQQKEARKRLREFADNVDVLTVDESVFERAAQAFLVEPVRSLDAIHLASILIYEQQIGGTLSVLSCDERIRANADAYGFDVLPAGPGR